MKIRNILSIKKLAVLGICVSFVAGGCGKMTESSIPELEEPVALNEAYRPVEYGTIGSIQVLMATAVPRDYCNYYSANVNISQIYVEPGDTVNVGDVLAVCDVDEAKKQLQECNDALAHENETYEISAQISDTQIKLWESQAADTDEFSTEQIEKKESTEEDYNTQIATEQENERYDKQLHEYRVQKINEQMALYQQIVDDGTLKAAHSGLVQAVGSGKMPEPEVLLDHIARELAREKTLAGVRVTVTAGPTQEALDPVRYLTNHSSGRMGYAIAREAMLRGAQVTLVSGPVDLPLVPFVETRPVTTAADMFRAVRDLLPATDGDIGQGWQ